MRITGKKVSQTAAGLASALALAFGASSAQAAPVTDWINLDYFNGDLAYATANGGGDQIFASVSQTSTGVSIEDVGYGAGVKSGTGDLFKFNYVFTIGAAGSSAVSALELSGSETSLSNVAVKLVDLTTHTVVTTAVAGTGNDLGDWTLSASNLSGTDKYDVVISGALVPGASGSVTAGLAGSLETVPLPGSLALFGSALIGLGGLARRRGAKRAAALGALLVVPAGLMLGATNADASTVTVTAPVLGAGSSSVLSPTDAVGSASKLGSNGSITSYAFFTPGGKAPSSGSLTKTPIGSATEVVYDYTFTASTAETISLSFSGISGGGISGLPLNPTEISLYDVTTGKTIATGTQGSGSNTVSLVAALTNVAATGEKVTDSFEIVVDLKGLTKSEYGTITGTGSVSAVPVPGALVLFGSGLVGLAAFGRRRSVKKAVTI